MSKWDQKTYVNCTVNSSLYVGLLQVVTRLTSTAGSLHVRGLVEEGSALRLSRFLNPKEKRSTQTTGRLPSLTPETVTLRASVNNRFSLLGDKSEATTNAAMTLYWVGPSEEPGATTLGSGKGEERIVRGRRRRARREVVCIIGRAVQTWMREDKKK